MNFITSKISRKISLFTIIIVLFISFLLGSISVYSEIKMNKKMLNSLEETVREDYNVMIKNQVDNVITLLDRIYKKYEAKEITLEQAKNLSIDLVRDLRYGREGYFWIDTVQGVNIVLLGSATEGTNRYNLKDVKGKLIVQEIISNGMKEDGGYTDYWFPKKGETEALPKRSYSKLFKPFNWVIGTGNYVDDIDTFIAEKKDIQNKELIKNRIIFIGMVIAFIFLAIILAVYFGKKITNPILVITNLINKTEALDLAYDKNFEEILNYKDETATIGKAVINLRDKLRAMVGEIQENSGEILNQSESLVASTNETVQSIDAVNIAVEELAKGATEQMVDAQNGVDKIQRLAKKIDNSVNSSNLLKKHSSITKNTNAQGLEVMENLFNKFKDNNIANAEVVSNIKILAEKSNSIGSIVNVIQSIAEQTNLLALNAAIEAARAGESGKGFAVVAEEVRKLAEQTAKSTQEISNVIIEIQKEITNAKENIDKGQASNEEANLSLEEAKKAFLSIEEAVEEMLEQTEVLDTNIREVNKSKDEVLTSIQQISYISEESAASTEEVSASMEEQSASMAEILGSTEKLKSIVVALDEIIRKFKL
ncbi:methyl-accepting chemotaxis protein [Clostridium tetanomorphum]|uniref:Chemotaxis protein n=1 Tax=Clostridium tetanomorphum TaxID=1553 RepID=A0A923EBI0_CLOTT|nr:cache domain-containing protein [Clostridium tetanomorphum]KAJ49365.1 methyl-accepting chemotaxis protein [Clostridium tetanomorphum DSM 665]KAJ52953.1 methyl-accepting chemotaxis protein [Clostridium tetanomorphum DSM 665]MBC2398206.1 chemotaxis protein [Clostridium tetanomorphum]MBP1864893.1 methyl-accepting chemotaxis protein [Clostridium tetanomorphum]NRS83099.1 methyl-accepting chemotaxis protein [Clostridium tetanomorphum]